MLWKSQYSKCAVSIRSLKNFFVLFAIDRLSKNNRGYHIPMLDLGKSKEVTVVLKL